MSKNIADLYNEVMSQAATEKTASAPENKDGAVFDRSFFEKVASGDEEAVGALNAFIDGARGEGYNDEQIETAIGEAMNEAGVDGAELAAGEPTADQPQDDFEMAKAAAYNEGVEEAFTHVMESEIVKTAGLTEQDLMQYELGLAKGQGYAETRAALEAVVEKIAAAKVADLNKLAEKGKGRAAAAGAAGVAAGAGGVKGYQALKGLGQGSAMAGAKGLYGAVATRKAGGKFLERAALQAHLAKAMKAAK